MVIVTGGAGFIGSAVVWKLNSEGMNDILIVDNLGDSIKWKNLVNRKYVDYIHKDEFIKKLDEPNSYNDISAVVHMGACSRTTEKNADYMIKNNYQYTKKLAEWTLVNNVRFIYASSAATYGDGSSTFSDDDRTSLNCRPLNIYGYSKQLFDTYAIRNKLTEKIAGIKFFNVFGPNEYHKEDMTSVIYKSFNQVKDTGKVKLFKSCRDDFKDGCQKRDFIYVKDCVEVIWWLLKNEKINGIYNLGTGKARTWNDLVKAVFSAMELETKIEYIDMPDSVKDQYQYFTEAKMDKLEKADCPVKFSTLEDAVHDYVVNYLSKGFGYL